MKAITIDGYLTESKLSKALQELLPECWLGEQVAVPGSRQRWDMSYQIGGKITVVEYDGDEHYRHSMKIKADRAKDAIARKQEFRMIHFPYWIQLDAKTLKYYFDLEAEVEQSFPHGFITTRLLPASFCELGVERFRLELRALPIGVREAVIDSVRERIAEHGLQFVVPKSLEDIVAVNPV